MAFPEPVLHDLLLTVDCLSLSHVLLHTLSDSPLCDEENKPFSSVSLHNLFPRLESIAIGFWQAYVRLVVYLLEYLQLTSNGNSIEN